MHIKLKTILTFCLMALLVNAAMTQTKMKSKKAKKGLKDHYETEFKIGAAINIDQIFEKDTLAKILIKKEFNTITPENIMKCEVIHPEWNRYNFEPADRYIEYGQNNNLSAVGHTLIWHSQLSPFVAKIKDKDSLELFIKNHITTIASRYDGKLLGWDVVNEAIEEDGTYRKSIFYKMLGESYLEKAFKWAAEATPHSELYYNDYNIEQPQKREGTIKMLKDLLAKGCRIDGVGIQGHWSINGLPYDEIEKSIIAYHELGLKVMFTELDITVLPNPWDLKGADVNQNFEGSPFMNPYPQTLPDSMQIKLALAYEKLFKLFIKHADKIDRVTFWGVSDGNSWLNGWPIRNRTNYPLLFDRKYKPKLAYKSVANLKRRNKFP
jgi:endo-1,4-beta-xylanase